MVTNIHQHEPGVVTRFAPSPTGYLHLGHAYSAIINFKLARDTGGRFLLRIEDIDQQRCRPEYVAAIFEDLHWLGLSWDEPPVRQSQRLAFYEARLASLHARGLVYRCFRTRQDIKDAMSAPHKTPARVFQGAPLAALEERDNLAEGRPYAWRLSLTAAEAALGPNFSRLTLSRRPRMGYESDRPNLGVSATWSSGGKTAGRAITSPPCWTTPLRASPA